MKALNLLETHRRYLMQQGAFSVNSEGCEVLVGLTLRESLVYIQMINEVGSGCISDDLNELANFLSLMNRHNAALPTSSFDIRTYGHVGVECDIETS
jgi:hypothetical protein